MLPVPPFDMSHLHHALLTAYRNPPAPLAQARPAGCHTRRAIRPGQAVPAAAPGLHRCLAQHVGEWHGIRHVNAVLAGAMAAHRQPVPRAMRAVLTGAVQLERTAQADRVVWVEVVAVEVHGALCLPFMPTSPTMPTMPTFFTTFCLMCQKHIFTHN